MKTPNIDKVKEALAILTNFPEDLLTERERIWIRAIVEHDLQMNEAREAIAKAESILESIRGTVALGGSRITVQPAAYDQIVEALTALREVTPPGHCAGGSGVGGQGS